MTRREYADPNNTRMPSGLSIVPRRWAIGVDTIGEPGSVDAEVRAFGLVVMTLPYRAIEFSPGTLVHKWMAFSVALHFGRRALSLRLYRERFAL